MGYDVFISYSHAGDELLSERVQDALGRFAKPWWRRRALHVFRDRTALSANPGLWTSISEAIDDSRFFLLLASPEFASSVWCQREVQQWRDRKDLEGLLVLLTDGEIVWDDATNDFDWTATTALGTAFAGCFTEEPLYLDMRWARSEVQLDLSDGRFRDQIAELAAPVHGVNKDDLAGADVKQHRRTLRHAFAAAIALVVLTLASVAATVVAVNRAAAAHRSATRARRSELLAEARLTAAQSQALLSSGDQTYQLGLVLTAEAVRDACVSVAADPRLRASEHAHPEASCSPEGKQVDPAVTNTARLALADAGGRFVTAQLAGNAPGDPFSNGSRIDPVAWSSDGRHLATYSGTQPGSPGVTQVWNADGSLEANVGTTSAPTTNRALSADGNVIALTSQLPGEDTVVSAWSLSSRRNLWARAQPGRRPALSGDGRTAAWIAPVHSKFVVVTNGAAFHRVEVRGVPVDVAVSPDGSLAAAVVHVGSKGDRYELVPIEVATGAAGRPVDVGGFANPDDNPWWNPPAVAPATSTGSPAYPPAAWFAPSGASVWVYNNERHIAVQIRHGGAAPMARKAATRNAPDSFDLTSLQASTPDGRTLVFAYNVGTDQALLQVSTLSGERWSTSGLAPLNLCSSNPCQLSISPNGQTLAARSLSALQVIDLAAANASSSDVATPHGGTDSITESPTGANAMRWNAHALVLIDTLTRTYRRVPVALDPGEKIGAVGFTPGGRDSVALITRGSRCPCRIVLVDAMTGRPLRDVALGVAALLDRRAPTAVAINDSADLVAVSFDDHPSDDPAHAHRTGLATYAADTGRPLQVHDDTELALGDRIVSVPAFQPGGDRVAFVTTTSSGQLTGLLMNARTGAIAGRLALSPGAALPINTVKFLTGSNSGYALRFSPDGRLLAWNRGGSVVLWSVDRPDSRTIPSQAVLTSSWSVDPTALAVSDDGAITTVGVDGYSTSLTNDHAVMLIGDARGRHLQPLGIAHFISASPGQMSVTADASGKLSAVAIDSGSTRVFTDSFGASPGSLLQQLCAAASAAMTEEQWRTYFRDEPYTPACTGPSSSPARRNFDVPSDMAVQAARP